MKRLPWPLIVVGASSGGVTALCELVKALPTPFPAPMYIVLHTGDVSILDEILTRCDSHFVRFVEDGEPIQAGIFVARPRRSLTIKTTTIELQELNGTKRRHWQPSIDELFETAAKCQGDQTIGVILSGTMNDGVEGLLAIQKAGGKTIVQEPMEAAYPGMPWAALEVHAANFRLPIKAIATKLAELVNLKQPG